MTVRHLFRRTRTFRYGGYWTLAVCAVLARDAAEAGGRALQGLVLVGFCAAWPVAADWLRRRGPAGNAPRFDQRLYWGECALTGLLLTWAGMRPLGLLAAAMCLLGGAIALAGLPLLLPAALCLLAGAALGSWLAPQALPLPAAAADAAAMLLILAFTLALGHLSFQQAVRLDRHRRALADESAALERVNVRLQRYLPPSLRDRISKAPDEPCRWERRWLTVTFVDLVGFTELSERLEAELLARVLDDYLAALIPAAERHGGEVSKVLGDGVLVVFGLRGADDRRAAVREALAFCREVPDLLDTLAGRWRGRGEPVVLRMRAGIASGLCTLGDRGGGGRLEFTLIGPPVNLASRLQAHAGVDGVLVDEPTAALAEDSRPMAPRRSLEVKGLGLVDAYGMACREAS